MKELGYGAGYRYDHDWEGSVAPQEYLPVSLRGRRFYRPADAGAEKRIADRIEAIRSARQTSADGERTRTADEGEG
jgi:putative ATPase